MLFSYFFISSYQLISCEFLKISSHSTWMMISSDIDINNELCKIQLCQKKLHVDKIILSIRSSTLNSHGLMMSSFQPTDVNKQKSSKL